MSLSDVANATRKRYWIIVVLVLVSVLAAALIGYIQNPVYKVEVTLAVVPPEDPTTKQPSATAAAIIVSSMASIANATESIGVAETAHNELLKIGIDIPAEELLDKMSATAEESSNALTLTFTDESPTRVTDIANTWAKVLAQKTLPPTSEIPNELYDSDFKEVVLDGIIRITSPAIPPQTPTQPKPLLYVGLGAFMGLILGIVIVILIEYFNPHFRSPAEVEEALEAPVLGMIPKIKSDEDKALLISADVDSSIKEAYSELRTGFIFSFDEDAMKSIIAAAAIPFGAGPSVSINLAASIAAIERSTLLIDCDIKGQAVTKLMGLMDKPGLSDSLKSGKLARDSVAKTAAPNLSILPAGTPYDNTTDLLSRPFFEDLLREMESCYDKVVLYAPSLSSGVDASIVASKVNANLLIVDSEKCTRRMATESMKSFGRLEVKPDGIILTNVKMKRFQRKQLAMKTAEEMRIREGKGKTVKPAAMEEGASKAVRKKRAKKIETAAPPAAEKALTVRPKKPTLIPGSEPTKLDIEEEEMRRMRETVSEDFHRLGETGAPIPRQWLKALNSDKPDIRESAQIAISSYYDAFLCKYSISDESIKNISDSIIKMMRREGEFSSMSEEEAQRHLQQMLVDAGARFSTGKKYHDSSPEKS
ncbi:MAG: hypothetical protein SWK76_05885 [Actinomycetota bacterium]|nr:hypothetical protein [Actinomycetota bacterium]